MLTRGYLLRDIPARLGWRTVLSMVHYAARDSAVLRFADGMDAEVNYSAQVLRSIDRSVRALLWRQTRDGQANPPRNPPDLIPLPSEVVGRSRDGRIGCDAMTREEVDAFLDPAFFRQ